LSIGRLQIISAKIPCNIARISGLPKLNLSVVKPWITKAEFNLSDTATLAGEIVLNAYHSDLL
jgi:hypothetical protein